MTKVRAHCFSISLDGYGAGPDQDLDHPLGVGGEQLHRWFLPTRTFRSMFGQDGGTTGVHDDFARRAIEGVGAWILGRNMFAPTRGPWRDDGWKGWWGESPPYHVPTFVLTHHARPDLVMEGGTTFHFVSGLDEALARARDAAQGEDVRIGGGVATLREALLRAVLDEVHLAISPVVLGRGEHLLSGIDLRALGYRVTEHVPTPEATHIVLTR